MCDVETIVYGTKRDEHRWLWVLKSKPLLSALLRIGVALLLQAVSLRFEWKELRFLVSEAVLLLSNGTGIGASRLSFDTLSVNGAAFQTLPSCTFIDVFFVSFPLLWNVQNSVAKNLVCVLICFVLVTALNLVRLEFGFVLNHWSVPLWLSHDAVTGVCYFLIFYWIVRCGHWIPKHWFFPQRKPNASSVAEPATHKPQPFSGSPS